MVDFVRGLYKDIYKTNAPAEYENKKQDVLNKLAKYEEDTEHIMNLLSVPAYPQQIIKGLIIVVAVLLQRFTQRSTR